MLSTVGIIIALVILGWLSGVLVNYLADILPVKRRLEKQICTACYGKQPWLNYFIWPRFCQACLTRRPWRTWLVEGFYILASIGLWFKLGSSINYLLGSLVLVYFGVIFVIDMEHRLILHPTSIFGALLFFFLGLYWNGLVVTLLGGVIGFSIMWALYWFGGVFARWLARRRGEVLTEDALGFGDVNFAGVLGLLLGWPGILAGLLLAIIIGGLVSLVYLVIMVILRRYHSFMAIPYGPFMVISAILLLFVL